MCCGGTVATMAQEAPSAIPSRRASSPTQAMSGPKLLRWGTGVPVEPEVNTQAAGRAAPSAGTDIDGAGTAGVPGGLASDAPALRGDGTRASAVSQSSASVRQTTAGPSGA